MSLKFNTFRSQRYLRTRFLEGRYLLASENTDLELEMLDKSRQMMFSVLGDIAIEDGWKVEKYSITSEVTDVIGNEVFLDTTILSLAIIGDEVYKNGIRIDTISNINLLTNSIIMPTIGSIAIGDSIQIRLRNTLLIRKGEAWYKGLPFVMASGNDNLVSGSNLATGITIPIGGGNSGVTAQDEPDGLGKLLSFNQDAVTTTPGLYRIAISAREEVITNIQDPFLKSANLPESTGQKMRLTYRINVVPESEQVSSPIPYTDSSTDGNLENEIIINPVTGGEGSEVSRTVLSGAEAIDGRNLEIEIKNTTGSNKLPLGSVQQQEYYNGKFIDSLGNTYHLNLITNSTTSNQVVLRIDKAPGQVDPVILDGFPYRIVKKDVVVTDDTNGNPLGQLFYPIATVNLVSGIGFDHNSKLTDLRQRVITKEDFEDYTNTKFSLKLTEGSTISWEVVDTDILDWASDFTVINPHGPEQTISTNSIAVYEGGSVVYDINLAGGTLERGNQEVTVLSPGAAPATTFSVTDTDTSVADLSNIRLGNIIKIGSSIRYITAISDISKTITLNTAIVVNPSTNATIYLDSYAPQYAPLSEKTFELAVRKNGTIYLGPISLYSGETNSLNQTISQAILDYIGAVDESDNDPDYGSYQITDITADVPANISDSEYFFIASAYDTTKYYVWFDKSGAAVDPTISGRTGIYVDITTAVTADDVAEAIKVAIDAEVDFSATRVGDVTTVTDVNIGPSFPGRNVNVAYNSAIFMVELVNLGSPGIVTQGVNLTAAITELDKEVQTINDILDIPIYDERTLFPSGVTALDVITIPVNSRNEDIQEQYVPGAGDLEIYINSRFVFEDEVWEAVDETKIRILIDLPTNTEIHFRKDSLGGAHSSFIITGVGGGISWSDPVDSDIIPDVNNLRDLGSSTNKFKDGYFAGKLTVDGVIDPTGVQLTPQPSSPFTSGQAGIYLDDTTEDLIVRYSNDTNTNITARIDNVEQGVGIDALSKIMTNISGSTIPAYSVVYSPSAGNIDLADGTDDAKARVIGVTTESILSGQTGIVAYAGLVSGISFTHGEYLYLDQTPGQLTETKPTPGPFPAGFTVVLIGIVEGTNLILQITPIGEL